MHNNDGIPGTPPGPRTPKLYNLYRHLSDFDDLVVTWRKEYGDIFYYRMPLIDFCIVHDRELIHEVFVAKRPDAADPHAPVFSKINGMDFVGKTKTSPYVENTWGLNGANDGAWYRRLVRLMAPGLLDDDFLQAHSARIIENIDALHTRWRAGEVIDLWNELRELQAHCVLRMNLGTAVDAIRPSTVVDTSEGYKQDMVLCLLPGTALLRKLPLPRSRSSKRAARDVSSLIYETIGRIREGRHDPYCMASRIIEANREEAPELRLSDRQVHDLVFENLTIPIDPGLITMTKAAGRVAYYRHVRERLEAEVEAVAGNRPIAVDDYDDLHYTRAILQETLRVSPPAPALLRVTDQDHVLGGYRVPKRTMVMCYLAAHHRDGTYWKRPDEFLPERWLEDPQPERPEHAYQPWGHGDRQCTGRDFAMRVGAYFLASTAQRMRLDTVEPGPLKERPFLFLHTVATPVRMRVNKPQPDAVAGNARSRDKGTSAA